MALEKCEWCKRFFKASELTHSDHHGGKVCRGCMVDQGPAERKEDGPSVVWVKEEGEWGL